MHHKTPELKSLIPMEKKYTRITLRHPDPTLTAKLVVNELELQILGSWKKLLLQKKGGMKARLAFTSFIWKSESCRKWRGQIVDSICLSGHLYVGGGGGETKGPWFRDLWCLDLQKLDGWRALPAYPVPERYTGVWMCWNLVVHKSRAYLFTGSLRLDFFDLESETWSSIQTTYNRTDADKEAGLLPHIYPGPSLMRSTQQVVRDKLYIFGGSHELTRIGCNLFMELDLETMEWRRLSGTLLSNKADFLCPGPRRTPSSWVDKNQEHIYLIGGEADRSAPLENELQHLAKYGFAYEDFWSWDIRTERWRMERLSGNPPCPRSEAACTYVGPPSSLDVLGLSDQPPEPYIG